MDDGSPDGTRAGPAPRECPLPGLPAPALGSLVDGLARDDRVVAAYVFGSRSRGTHHRESDLDLGVLVTPEAARRGFPEEGMASWLGPLVLACGQDLHAVVLNGASAVLAMQVLRHGVRILERDRRAARDWEARMNLRYLDEMPVLARTWRSPPAPRSAGHG